MQFGADFQSLIERFSPESDKPIALAVSGGSDSLALLRLTYEWAKAAERSLITLTVDHRLRPEARQEAEMVASLSAKLGHSHQTLTWDRPRPSQAAARNARYELLARAARTSNAQVLLTGHTFDDVVETAMIRRRRGVRDPSIAGPVMAAPVPVWPAGRAMTLLRPLIQTNRSDLRAYLSVLGQTWVDDPSNASTVYERVRVREFLARHPRLLSIARDYVREEQNTRSFEQTGLAANLSRVEIDPSGLIDTALADPNRHVLKLLIRCASGTADNPRDSALRELLGALTAPGQRQTLGGAWVQRTKTGFLIGRDPASPSPDVSADVFDGRFETDPLGALPDKAKQPFLVRQSSPPGPLWREIISERLAHLIQCYQTPLLTPVQR
ncbi:MAG: tRNA lysidine(34) synthetase TilS [Henriciella sp.]|nr:tRNA lysidine(34) synthetase TilS [Henriciella sp.]